MVASFELDLPDVRSTTTIAAQGQSTVELVGSVESGAADHLEVYFRHLHDAMTSAGSSEVRVDLTALEFMTAACLKRLLSWFATIDALPEDARYKVRLRGSHKHSWQQRSLLALACYSVRFISIEWDS